MTNQEIVSRIIEDDLKADKKWVDVVEKHPAIPALNKKLTAEVSAWCKSHKESVEEDAWLENLARDNFY